MFFIKTIPRIYLISSLLAAMLLSPLPHSAIASILLLLQVYFIYRPLGADLNLALTFSTLFIIPLTLEPAVGEWFAVLFAIPVLPLLDFSLREKAWNQDFHLSEGRKPTTLLITLSTAIIAMLVLSLILANWALSLTSALLATYLIVVSIYVLYSVPKAPLQASYTRVRIIAGDTSNISVAIENGSKLALHSLFTSPHLWVRLDSDRFKIERHEVRVNLALTPSLSGPSKPRLQALMTDPWGLVRMNQNLKPVEMHVIPRAKYAAWLANKFLGQGTRQISPAVTAASPSEAPIASRRGVEYLSSRPYQPGDKLKDMDWKHMCKLNELIVKEYIEAKGLSTIIAVNLTVKDAEESDKLAYNLITLALTLARTAAPTALAAYNHQGVLLTTEALEPREILKRALKLERDIVIDEPVHRFLQTPDIRRLRRTMNQLEQAKTEPAQKIADLLRFENQAIQRSAKDHPAAQAITKVTAYVHTPATIAVVSGWNHDAEALLATLDRLERQGYNPISIDTTRKY